MKLKYIYWQIFLKYVVATEKLVLFAFFNIITYCMGNYYGFVVVVLSFQLVQVKCVYFVYVFSSVDDLLIGRYREIQNKGYRRKRIDEATLEQFLRYNIDIQELGN
eukprot:TRINITY_DN595_c1_g2_i5.p10 TRINITY_DN595_c1_g2~~TRINITY_DN595_c1_g2_i5.p10  ORF type:complete len:106 (-),score=3.99 TRINITY_DN595_c1_g2_i5:138-455(-)